MTLMSKKTLTPSILSLVASGIQVKGSKRFVADKTSIKEANIGWTGSNFDRFFLDKVEEDIGDATIAIHRLEKSSVDAPIRKELGENREETKLVHLFDLIRKQSEGQQGHLLVNGYANVAYIRGKDGNLRVVNARWYSNDRYWSVDASSVENPREWLHGDHVLSSDC